MQVGGGKPPSFTDPTGYQGDCRGSRRRERDRSIRSRKKQWYWLESTASHGREEGGLSAEFCRAWGQRSPLCLLVWQNMQSVRNPHRQRLCGVHAASSIPQFSATLMSKIGVFRRLGVKVLISFETTAHVLQPQHDPG